MSGLVIANQFPPPPAAPPAKRAWFLTLTGQQFFYDDPAAYPYSLVEIAHVLSKECRFGSHLADHYDVALHSVLVARTVEWLVGGRHDLRLLRAAMLHDASEAFLRDIPRPLKHLPAMAPYRELEDLVQRAIMRAFGLEDLHDHPRIKEADQLMLEAEKRALRPASGFRQEYDERESSPVFVYPMPAEESRELFMGTWVTYAD